MKLGLCNLILLNERRKAMDNNEVLFEVETLQDWRVEAGANQVAPEEPAPGGGASNSNSTNNSADEP